MRQRLRVFSNNQVVFIYLCIHIRTYIIKEKRLSPWELVWEEAGGAEGRRARQKLMHFSLIKLYLKIKISQSACMWKGSAATRSSQWGGHCHVGSHPYSPFRTTGHSWQCTGSTHSFGLSLSLSGGLCNPQQGRQFTKQNRQILLCGRALLTGWQAKPKK